MLCQSFAPLIAYLQWELYSMFYCIISRRQCIYSCKYGWCSRSEKYQFLHNMQTLVFVIQWKKDLLISQFEQNALLIHWYYNWLITAAESSEALHILHINHREVYLKPTVSFLNSSDCVFFPTSAAARTGQSIARLVWDVLCLLNLSRKKKRSTVCLVRSRQDCCIVCWRVEPRHTSPLLGKVLWEDARCGHGCQKLFPWCRRMIALMDPGSDPWQRRAEGRTTPERRRLGRPENEMEQGHANDSKMSVKHEYLRWTLRRCMAECSAGFAWVWRHHSSRGPF